MNLEAFVAEWDVDPAGVKEVFVQFKDTLETTEGVQVKFHARPGISYSMRGVKVGQDQYPLFVMVDVIDDDPDDRWLSVCFFGETITDPDELGDIVPGGLLGRDGHCFDVDGPGGSKYLVDRIAEAFGNQ